MGHCSRSRSGWLAQDIGQPGHPCLYPGRAIVGLLPTRRAVLAAGRASWRRMDGLVTTKWWKEERNGVFIDYNQNARDKSVCSAYGVRPTGYVSTPITWDELADVAIEDFLGIVCQEVRGGWRPHRGHRRVGGSDRHADGVGGPGSRERSRRRAMAAALSQDARRAAPSPALQATSPVGGLLKGSLQRPACAGPR